MKLHVITREAPPQDLDVPYDLMSPDSMQGQQAAQLYGVTQYPAWIITQSNGSLVQLWQGSAPSRSELSYYLNTPI